MRLLKCALIFAFLFFSIGNLNAQYFPGSEAKLNYNSICFEFPFQKNADNYTVTLYDEAQENPQTYSSSANKIIVPELEFGASYFWKVTAKKGNKTVFTSPVNHFSIQSLTKADDVRFLKITYKKPYCSNELMIYDYAGLMLDRSNRIYWMMPEALDGVPVSEKGVRDLKMTVDGTFLALIDSMAFEFDRNGKILWQAPNTGEISHRSKEDYHHDMVKLENGNYMVLGNERLRTKFAGERDSVTYESGFVVEYSPQGQLVWYWKASDFFTKELLAQRRKPDGKVNPATHMNSFHADGNFVYVGFRDASWILKVDKSTKEVVEIYGGHDSGLEHHYGKELFRFQHDTELIPDKNAMVVVNNDSIADPAVFSSMVVFSLGDNEHEKGELLFKFPFNFDARSPGKSQKLGNVTPLKNGNYLINMGALNRVVEIQPDGTVVWDCFTEKLDSVKKYWHTFQQYRVSTTPSLYPNEYSVNVKNTKYNDDKTEISLTLFNVGSETFTYGIYAGNNTQKAVLVKRSTSLSEGQQENITVTVENSLDATYMEIVPLGTNNIYRIPLEKTGD